MGRLTFSINSTLNGCVDHQEGIANEETHAFFTRLMDAHGAMLWGHTTYEMMAGYWPAVARGEVQATPAVRAWATQLQATALDRLDLIDEYQLLVHPRIAGHGPTLYAGGLPATRRLDLISATPLRYGAVAMHYRRAG
jgi:hypothetical protein